MTERNNNPRQKTKEYSPNSEHKEIKSMKKQEVAQKEGKKVLEIPQKQEATKKEDIFSPKEHKEKKKKEITKPKREFAIVRGESLPISTKTAADICKFIKRKNIEKAISDLEQVVNLKRAVPMKGEFPHKKGMNSGKFPVKAAKNFIILLKSLRGNANNHGVEEPIIIEAFANNASRPYGKFGSVRRKRTNVLIKAKSRE